MKQYLAKDKILLALRAVTSIGVIVFLLFYVELKTIVDTLASADLVMVLIVFLLSVANLYFQFLKWKLVVFHQLNENNNLKILQSLFYGIGAGLFTPAKIGEYVSRAIPFKDKKISDVSIATFIDKIFGMIIIAAIGGLFFIYFCFYKLFIPGTITLTVFMLIVIGLAIIPLTLLTVVVFRKNIASYFSRWEFIAKLVNKLSVIRMVKGRYLLKLFTFSFLYYLIFSLQFTILIGAFSTEFHFAQFYSIVVLVYFAQIAIPPIFLGELGIREGAAVFFMKAYGYEPSVGFNAALCLFFINFILPSFYSLFITSAKTK